MRNEMALKHSVENLKGQPSWRRDLADLMGRSPALAGVVVAAMDLVAGGKPAPSRTVVVLGTVAVWLLCGALFSLVVWFLALIWSSIFGVLS